LAFVKSSVAIKGQVEIKVRVILIKKDVKRKVTVIQERRRKNLLQTVPKRKRKIKRKPPADELDGI